MRTDAVPLKTRFSIILPVVQVTITGILRQWQRRYDWLLFGGGGRRIPGPFAHLHSVAVRASFALLGVVLTRLHSHSASSAECPTSGCWDIALATCFT
jgi:hypothetical protein